MFKLSKSQKKIVQRRAGTFVMIGEIHSGKTSIATLRMIHLLEHACPRGEEVLYVCKDQNERKKVIGQYHDACCYQNVSLFDDNYKGEALITDIDTLMEEAAQKAQIHLGLSVCEEVPSELIEALLPKERKLYPKVKWLKPEYVSFIQDEIKWIDSCGYTKFEAYVAADRKGAKIKLTKRGNGRKAIWHLREEVSRMLKEQGYMTKHQLQVETLQYLKEDVLRKQYKHLIMDDAHGMTKVQLENILLLKDDSEGEVFFVMNPIQKCNVLGWLEMGNSFKSIGYEMTGRIKRLTQRKQERNKKKSKEVVQTPLETFVEEMAQKAQEQEKHNAQKKVIKAIPKETPKKSALPWYVETYQYVNKITGVETIFQRDSSAGETYIDEVKQDEVDVIPIFTEIAAGMPIELVDEVSGKFELPSELLHHKKNTYILHVQGDSMIGAGISNGDYVVIQAGNVNNHEIAAVYYNGATTLKRIVQEEDHILLVSENPKYRPIVIEDGEFSVMGKLVGVIKSIS